jgi:MAF protein
VPAERQTVIEYWFVTELILASASPRRREIIAHLQLPFRVQTADVDESPLPGETPRAMVSRLSRAKADAIAALAPAGAIVLAADTTVVIDGLMIGKPLDAAEAHSILRRLRGRPHEVYTAFTLAPVGASPRGDWLGLCRTLVHMRDYGDDELAAFVASRRPFDKAGGYAIQDPEFRLVRAIEGCYLNVMGLPLCEVIRGLCALGVPVAQDEPILHDCLDADGGPCYAP